MLQKSKSVQELTATDLPVLTGQLRREVIGIRQLNTEIKKEVSTISGMLLKKLEDAEQEISDLKLNVAQLQYHAAFTEQNNLKNYIEISGISEYDDENLCEIVIVTSQKMGVELFETDIDEVQRVGTKPGKRYATHKLWRPIVVKLVSRLKRNELLKASKVRPTITSEDIVDGEPMKIYMNERLTQENRRLFREARQRAEKYNFRYCWVRNGAILVRESDGMPAIRIMSWADLDEHVGPAFPMQAAAMSLPSEMATESEAASVSEPASEST